MVDIVLADDDADFRESVTWCLEDAGHAVRTVGNGEELLAQVEVRVPDLVITDIVMPEQEGIGAILSLRRAEVPAKILAISGGDSTGGTRYLGAAAELGADAILPKPFTPHQLLDAIADLGFRDRARA